MTQRSRSFHWDDRWRRGPCDCTAALRWCTALHHVWMLTGRHTLKRQMNTELNSKHTSAGIIYTLNNAMSNTHNGCLCGDIFKCFFGQLFTSHYVEETIKHSWKLAGHTHRQAHKGYVCSPIFRYVHVPAAEFTVPDPPVLFLMTCWLNNSILRCCGCYTSLKRQQDREKSLLLLFMWQREKHLPSKLDKLHILHLHATEALSLLQL